MGGDAISRINKVNDLGIHVDSKLTCHVGATIASKIMDFIFRQSLNCRNIETLIVLFSSLESILENSTIV